MWSTLWSIFLTIVWGVAGLMFIFCLYQMIKGLISPEKIAEEGKEVETRKGIFGSHLIILIVFGVICYFTMPSFFDKENQKPESVTEEGKSEIVAKEVDPATARRDSLNAARERFQDKRPSTEILNEALRNTKAEVYRQLRKPGVSITEFPSYWSWFSYSYHIMGASINKEDEIEVTYRIFYDIKFSHNGVERESRVSANATHNTANDTWTAKVWLKEFNQYWVDTPEGQKESEEAANELFGHLKYAEKAVLSISANALYVEYLENLLRADSKYKGKTIEVHGTVKDLGKDKDGNPYIFLKADKSSFFGVVCFLYKESYEDAFDISKGQNVKIKGTVAGKPSNNVLLVFCKIIK